MQTIVITANIGSNSINTAFQDDSIKFVKWDNSNCAPRIKSMNPRLQGKIPKMLAWEFYPDYDRYIWMDSNFFLRKKEDITWLIEQLGDSDIAFFKHPNRKTIEQEYQFVEQEIGKGNPYLLDRYQNEHMKEQVDRYLKTPGFKDDILLYGGLFVYTKNAFSMLKEWFYHNCLYSVQDQLSLPYILFLHQTNYTIIPGNPYNLYIK